MSSEIIYRLQAVKISKEFTGDYDDNFIMLAEIGSSNCWEVGRNRRSRDWTMLHAGQHYRSIARCCELAADCEGGMLKMGSASKWCKPEQLLRAWRKALETAIDGMPAAHSRGFGITMRIRMTDKDATGDYKDKFTHLCSKRGVPQLEEQYGTKYHVFKFNHDSSDVLMWLNNQHGAGWNNATVIGPGD